MKKVKEDPKDPNSQVYKYNVTRENRKALQKEYDEEFKQSLEDMKDKIREYEAPDIKEAMLEERRKWIYDFYELNEGNDLPKKVTEFYDKDKVMKPLTPEEEEEKRKAEEDKKKEEKKKKDAKKNAKGKKAKKDTPVILLVFINLNLHRKKSSSRQEYGKVQPKLCQRSKKSEFNE